MLCRGNAKTAKMFDIAWNDYKVCIIKIKILLLNFRIMNYKIISFHTQSITKPIKHNPGKDQNKVVFAMRVSRG